MEHLKVKHKVIKIVNMDGMIHIKMIQDIVMDLRMLVLKILQLLHLDLQEQALMYIVELMRG